MRNIKRSTKRFTHIIIILLAVFIGLRSCELAVLADPLPSSELQALSEYPNWVASTGTTGSGSCMDTSSTTPTTDNQTGDEFTLSQVETFIGEPVTSTWNISNSTVEQWFLEQASAQPVIAQYGLTSNNIGQITSAVEAAGVSPVLFYLITVNEGGTGGGTADDGFINYTNRGSDTGLQAAQADAQQIITDINSSDPPGTGGGEPSDMPTAEAQSILKSLPSGSIGDYYIVATSAVTAELEDLSGETGDWTGLYGMPLSTAMQNIKTMGGDPAQGGTVITTSGPTTTCTGDDIAGQGIEKAINWAVAIANNNGYGYDQTDRTSGWAKWQSDPSCTNQCGSFDCSSFIAAALTEGGFFPTNPEFATGDEETYLTQAGFTKVADSVTTSDSLLPGDILVWSDHTEMYIGNNQNVGAHINELGTATGGQVGDQTGQEISVQSFESSLVSEPWIGVFRAPN